MMLTRPMIQREFWPFPNHMVGILVLKIRFFHLMSRCTLKHSFFFFFYAPGQGICILVIKQHPSPLQILEQGVGFPLLLCFHLSCHFMLSFHSSLHRRCSLSTQFFFKMNCCLQVQVWFESGMRWVQALSMLSSSQLFKINKFDCILSTYNSLTQQDLSIFNKTS